MGSLTGEVAGISEELAATLGADVPAGLDAGQRRRCSRRRRVGTSAGVEFADHALIALAFESG